MMKSYVLEGLPCWPYGGQYRRLACFPSGDLLSQLPTFEAEEGWHEEPGVESPPVVLDQGSTVFAAQYAAVSAMSLVNPDHTYWPISAGKRYFCYSVGDAAQDVLSTGKFEVGQLTSLDAIGTALSYEHPVVFGLEIGRNFGALVDEHEVLKLKDDPSLGGHALVAYGLRKTQQGWALRCQSSFGEQWGSPCGQCQVYLEDALLYGQVEAFALWD